MKTTSRQKSAGKPRQRFRKLPKTLEDSYKRVFVCPTPNSPVRERLSMYKSVPSVTTYGVYDKPV